MEKRGYVCRTEFICTSVNRWQFLTKGKSSPAVGLCGEADKFWPTWSRHTWHACSSRARKNNVFRCTVPPSMWPVTDVIPRLPAQPTAVHATLFTFCPAFFSLAGGAVPAGDGGDEVQADGYVLRYLNRDYQDHGEVLEDGVGGKPLTVDVSRSAYMDAWALGGMTDMLVRHALRFMGVDNHDRSGVGQDADGGRDESLPLIESSSASGDAWARVGSFVNGLVGHVRHHADALAGHVLRYLGDEGFDDDDGVLEEEDGWDHGKAMPIDVSRLSVSERWHGMAWHGMHVTFGFT